MDAWLEGVVLNMLLFIIMPPFNSDLSIMGVVVMFQFDRSFSVQLEPGDCIENLIKL